MIFSTQKKRIAKVRFTFFLYEIALVFVFLFIMLIIPVFLIPLIVEEGSNLYGIVFYLIRAIIVFLGIPLILYLTNLLFVSQKQIILDEDLTPATGHLKLYKINKKNYKYQILYGFLIFFVVFLPIDFFTYSLIPGAISFQAFVLGIRSTNFYLSPLSDNYFIFLISAIIIQFSVAFTEETVSRGFFAKRGSEYFLPMSAVMISSLYFGLGHLAFLLDATSWIPVIMFVETFVVGIILALFVLRKKWILPVIIAHALNNIVSAHTIWSFWQNISFQITIFYVYIPLFIIGVLFVTVCLLLVWDFSNFREGLSNGFSMFKTYFKRESKENERNPKEVTRGDTLFRIFIDIIIALLIFLMGMLIAV
jgi:membrane protease YdiL (CAAX protease family)